MRLLVSPKLTLQDVRAIRESVDTPEKFIEGKMLLDINAIEDELLGNHVKALAWMHCILFITDNITSYVDDLTFYESGFNIMSPLEFSVSKTDIIFILIRKIW